MALELYHLTFNCGRALVQPDVFAPYLFQALGAGSSMPELLVLYLQELAPLASGMLGGSFLTPYFNAFRQVVKLASKEHSYVNIISRNLGLTAIMVFARDDIADNVRWLHTAGTGVGLYEMGNKGAVGVRLGYQRDGGEEVQLTFVAAHLAPMEGSLEQRNEDFKNIVQRLVFTPDSSGKPIQQGEEREDAPLLQPRVPSANTSESGIYCSTSHLFFAGDLNYRTSLLPPSAEDAAKRFPQPCTTEDDPRHYSHLLADDQLTQQVQAGKALHGLTEMPITFPPTYKYKQDREKPVQLDGEQDWSWARHRWPSWCDRIFFWASGDVPVHPHAYASLPLFATSDHRPVALSASVPARAVKHAPGAEKAPYSIDPDWKSKRVAGRRNEIAVGVLAYLALTWEGRGLLLSTVVGAVGAWYILSSLLMA